MNTTFERTKGSDEWYTPKWVIDALRVGGVIFDTDPCAPVTKPYEIAPLTYDKTQNGLDKEWVGNVWLNPPYSHPLIEKFVMRLVTHGNGILLTFDRCDNGLWQKVIFPHADGVFFYEGKVEVSGRGRKGATRGGLWFGACCIRTR